MNPLRRHHLLVALALYAVSMACVEAGLVVYLRDLYYLDHPRVIFPLRTLSESHLVLELIRETATVVMIFAVAFLAVRGVVPVFAAFVFVFGLWDLFYYAWLKVLMGWPVSWSEWDVLFLIPWPWFGPWLTAAAIALLFVIWGGMVLANFRPARFSRLALGLFSLGTLLALAAFLAPAWSLLPGGIAAFENYTPRGFPWVLYLPGFAFMSISLFMPAPTTSR